MWRGRGSTGSTGRDPRCGRSATASGARAAAQHVVDLGHRRVALIIVAPPDGDPAQVAHSQRERVAGWTEVLSDAGIEPVVSEIPSHGVDQAATAAGYPGWAGSKRPQPSGAMPL